MTQLKTIVFKTLTIKTVWSEWAEGHCSVTCGKGTFTSKRKCLQGTCFGESTKTEDCEVNVCPGKYIYFILLIKFLSVNYVV